ncbi:SDR family NAD(P)-dependent oxidoreductase [Oceanomicrobium pacificus]|uniref:SDR family NAD(P)-dependent oxidoreductase n=1 Tax=Oceanomicrobium pacificus TaxID=2692916 RepID=A0A6B0TVR3_9RHOB|nr:SDR family oxidoreductase [Oceanomicrobium pacificus]MXU65648.1 SDR family NAD(P)-dependent oxidoreductase [Oceanomicrobium pacificus]
MRDFNGKVALVTGASRGLGYAVARDLGAKGAHVIALARTVGGLEELDDEIKGAGGQATLLPLDLTDEGGLQRMGKAIHDRWGGLDLLVHAAAHAAPLAPVGHVGDKDLDRCWAVNGRATQRLITMTDPLLRARDGSKALFVTHDAARGKFHTAYGMSKAAARAVIDAYAAENDKIGPDVLTFEPEPMPTALRARFHPGEDRARLTDPSTEAVRLITLL